jgi:hypothetical protein
MQRQLEHTKRIDIAALTVCSNGRNRSMVGTTAAYNEFPHSTGRVKNSVGCLRSKPFIDVVMATQDKVHVIIVQGLPNGLHIRGSASPRTKDRDVPVCQSTKVCVGSQIRGKPLSLRG